MASKRIKRYLAGIAIVAVIAIAGTWAYFAQQGDSSSATPPAFRPASEIVGDLKEPPATPTGVYRTQDFTVGARYFYTLILDLQPETQVEYSFEAEQILNFEVLDPQGNRISLSERVLADKGTFTARKFGRYSLVFDNRMGTVFNPGSITYRVIPPGGR